MTETSAKTAREAQIDRARLQIAIIDNNRIVLNGKESS